MIISSIPHVMATNIHPLFIHTFRAAQVYQYYSALETSMYLCNSYGTEDAIIHPQFLGLSSLCVLVHLNHSHLYLFSRQNILTSTISIFDKTIMCYNQNASQNKSVHTIHELLDCHNGCTSSDLWKLHMERMTSRNWC